VEVTRRKRAQTRWLGLLLSIAITWTIVSPARADANQDARTSFEQGVEASRAQRWDDARQLFKRSLELVPKPSTLFNLAIANIKLGHGGEALEELDALELLATPSEHAAILERARILRAQAQALVESKQATEAHGGNVLTDAGAGLSDEVRRDVAAGRDHYARGRDRLALAAFERAYEACQRPELLYNIAVVADRLRDDERAIRAYDQYVEARPDAPQASVAQVRSEALRASLREHPVPPAVERTPVLASPELPARDDRRQDVARGVRIGRALLVTGAVLGAGAVGSGLWLAGRIKDLDTCAGSATPCVNEDDIRGEKTLAVVSTVTTAVLTVGLTTAGAVALVRAKRRAESARAGLVVAPLLALGRGREAGMALRAQF